MSDYFRIVLHSLVMASIKKDYSRFCDVYSRNFMKVSSEERLIMIYVYMIVKGFNGDLLVLPEFESKGGD